MKKACAIRAPRPGFVYEKACDFIVRQNICVLPADPFRAIESSRWGLVSYRKLAGTLQTDARSLSSLCGLECATIFNGRNYCIVYDSTAPEFAQVVRELFGEIGHIVLGHFELDGSLTGSVQDALAEEARMFALYVMAPSVVISACELDSVQELCCACGLTAADAEKRLSLYRDWKPCEGDACVRETLRLYIAAGVRSRLYAPVDALFDEIRGMNGTSA